MSGYPGGGQRDHYDDGYGNHGGTTDSYYQDDQQYYDQNGYDQYGSGQQGHDGYYDESCVLLRFHFEC